ncbi:kelch-like protein 33 [Aplochiton taeniatus]
MEFTRRYLPMEWQERWRRDKERRRRVMEEGGERIQEVDRELRWIMAYNDNRMGVKGQSEKEGSKVTKINSSPTSQKEEEEGKDKGEEMGNLFRTYGRDCVPREVFQALENFRDSSLLTDLTLSTEDGQSVDVHSPVLAAVSSYIHQRLQVQHAESVRRPDLTGVDVDRVTQMSLGPEVDRVGLQGVVEFAYTGAVASLNRDTLVQIQAAAHTLGVPRVLDLCTEEEERRKREGEGKKESKVSAAEQMRMSLQSIRVLWEERLGCDVVLEVDGALFHVHRVVMAASSDYFQGMFTSGMRESQQPRVTLPFLVASELEALIGCSYSGALPLSWGCVFEITCTALQLQFPHALSMGLDFLKEEMDAYHCLDVASFAEAYGMSELLREAEDFVLRNFQLVSTTAKFHDLPPEKLLLFLRSDGLCVASELTAFRAVASWVEADPEERLGQAEELMTGVRFPLMTFREFREVRAVNLRLECSSGDRQVDLYRPALEEFGFSCPEAQDRRRVRRPKDAVVVVGGDRLDLDTGQRRPSAEVWFANSLRSGTGLMKDVEWRRLGELPEKPRFRHGVGAMAGKLYVVGGCNFYAESDTLKSACRYDPLIGRWERLADMQEFRSNFAMVVWEGGLYAIGGDQNINSNTDSVEVYFPEEDSWRYAQPLEHAMSGHVGAVLDKKIFISGGFNSEYQCLGSFFSYRPDRGTTYLAAMERDRAQHCMEALGGHLYVAGGICNQRTFYADQLACEVYHPATDSWSPFPPLPIPHVGAASAVLEGKFYVLGGFSAEDHSESRSVHRVDPISQRWELTGRMPGANTDVKACLLRLPQHLRQ